MIFIEFHIVVNCTKGKKPCCKLNSLILAWLDILFYPVVNCNFLNDSLGEKLNSASFMLRSLFKILKKIIDTWPTRGLQRTHWSPHLQVIATIILKLLKLWHTSFCVFLSSPIHILADVRDVQKVNWKAPF